MRAGSMDIHNMSQHGFLFDLVTSEGRETVPNWQPSNNGLHQTGRGGVAHVPRRGPVVEARPAGEAGCYAHHWWLESEEIDALS